MMHYYIIAAVCLLSFIVTESFAQSNTTHDRQNNIHGLHSFLNNHFGQFNNSNFSLSQANESSPNDIVRAIATTGSEVYIAGNFSFIGGKRYSYIAHWNGVEWQTLGPDFPLPGADGPIQTITIDGDNVYIGGEFSQVGTVKARNIAVWSRSKKEWSTFQGGVGGTLLSSVKSIVVHNGQVYVGGRFIAAGNTVAANIARWDGRRWHRVGTGANARVNVLHIEGEYLYAGGNFSIAGDIPVSRLARYHIGQKRWEDIGHQFDGRQARIEAIASDDTYLYLGGVFETVDNRPASNIIRMDKQSLQVSPMLEGLDGYSFEEGGSSQVEGVRTIIVQGSDVIVGGTITQARKVSNWLRGEFNLLTPGIVRWNGEQWYNPIDTSARSSSSVIGPIYRGLKLPVVYALASTSNDSIWVGGDFEGFMARPPEFGFKESPFLVKIVVDEGIFVSGTSSNNTIKKNAVLPVVDENPLPQDTQLQTSSILTQLHTANSSSPSLTGLDCAQYSYQNQSWHEVGSSIATDNGVLALAADAKEVYAGGTFTTLFGIKANGIAVRKNGEWYEIDDGISAGVNGFVYAITIDGPNVYVGGQFTRAGGTDAQNIAVWNRNTETWSALGKGMSNVGSQASFISDIAFQNGRLYAAGKFTNAGDVEANNIACWNNGKWEALGEGVDGNINALQFFRGNLYAGGSFSTAGSSTNSNGLAFWDGQRWHGMQGNLDGFVNDLDTSQSMLIIGGRFTVAINNTIVRNLIWSTGAGFTSFYSDSGPNGTLEAVEVLNGEVRSVHFDGSNLYVGGNFTATSPLGGAGKGNLNIARLKLVSWANKLWPIWYPLRGGLNGSVNAMAKTDQGLYIGGDFTKAPGQDIRADHIALWNTIRQQWDIAGNPYPLYPVQAMIYTNNSIYAAGQFTAEEEGPYTSTTRIVRFTDRVWRSSPGIVQGKAAAFQELPKNEFVLGGTTITSDGKIAINVSRYNTDTEQWASLTPGSGVASLEDISFVSAVVGNDQSIVVGGQFDIADTMTAYNIARWDRNTEQWSTLGEGLNGIVRALTFDQNGNLYAAGEFSGSGSTSLRGVAHWNGSEWKPLGDGINGKVLALASLNGKIYAGGHFRSAGQTEAINVAVWNPDTQSWSSLGLGLDSDFQPLVNVLTARGGHLFAGGKFEVSGPDSIVNVARWNPGGWWDRLGSGTDQLVSSIAINSESGDVYVSGAFDHAGCKPMQYIARWVDPTLSVEQESPLFTYTFTASTHPNPFTGRTRVHVDFSDPTTRQVELVLFDEKGQLVQRFPEAKVTHGQCDVEIDGKNLTSGAYFMYVKSTAGTGTVKLVKR